MTAFETTIQNIQKILDAINGGHYSSKIQVANAVGVSPTLVHNCFKKLEPEIYCADSAYKATCMQAEETEFYKKFSEPLEVVRSNFTIFFWQNKYIASIFGLSMNEVQALRTYVYDEIRNIRDSQIKKRETACYNSSDKAVCSDVEENEFFEKLSDLIPIVLSNPTILFWQNKYISYVFGLSSKEVLAMRAKVKDVIQDDEVLQDQKDK